ncbi:MAG TPA: hypothetical protein VJK06_02140 [Methyloceanibacter sp.]|nr:hypothetical protein [Methyloceanibacter sp.]
MSARLLIASALFLAGAALALAEDRKEKHHNMDADSDALGFGIQGEHFDALPIDAGTIAAPSRGPAVKLDAEEEADAKDDNPDPALGDAGPSPLGMPEASSQDGN